MNATDIGQGLRDALALQVEHPRVERQYVAALGEVGDQIGTRTRQLGELKGIGASAAIEPVGFQGTADQVGRGVASPFEVVDDRVAIGIKALAVDAPTTAVLTVGHPAHHITAVAEPGDRRCVLIVASGAVDPHLVTHRDTAGIVALRINAVAAAVLVGHPAHHIATARQRADRRFRLIA
ncbi:hypothetical protein D3C86_1724160 [compost metagenome]